MLNKILVLSILIINLIVTGFQSKEKLDFTNNEPTHQLLKMLPVPSGLGVNIHFYEGNKNDLQMLKDAGVGIVRMDVSWGGVEKSKGQYDFSRHDKLVKDLETLGIRLIFIIDYGNPLYDNGLAPNTEEGRNAYAEFCSVLAARYSGKKIIWELWNEPNIDKFWLPATDVNNYMAFCKTIVPAIRDKDLNACIIAPATSAFDMKFMESCFEQGLLDLVDGVSVHPYRNSYLTPETTFDEFQLLSFLIEQYKPKGKSIPIISGEWGYTTADMSRKLQGKYLAHQWLSNLVYNIPVSIWYDWHDDGQDPKEGEHNFGTVTWDYKEKPSYVSMKTLIKYFNGYQAIGRIGLDSFNDYLLILKKESQIKLALWSTANKHYVSLGKDLQLSNGIDYLDKDISVIDNEKIEISDKPIYFNVDTPYPDWIKLISQTNNLTSVEAENVGKSYLSNNNKNDLGNTIRKFLKGDNSLNINAAEYSLLNIAGKISRNDALNIYHLLLDVSSDLVSSKKALIEIAKIGSEKSMEIVTPKLNDAQLMKEASLYYLNLAYKMVIDGNDKNAEKLIFDVIKFSPPRYAVDRILTRMQKANKNIDPKLFRQMAKSAGFINDWMVIGPFSNMENIGQTAVYTPEKSIDISRSIKYKNVNLRWKNIQLDGVFPVIPLADIYGREQLVAYAFAEVKMNKTMSAILKIGSNDGVVCWVNGNEVHKKFIGRALTIDEDLVKVNLISGINKILLKVLNRGNNWEACVRVCDSDGKPIDLTRMNKIRDN